MRPIQILKLDFSTSAKLSCIIIAPPATRKSIKLSISATLGTGTYLAILDGDSDTSPVLRNYTSGSTIDNALMVNGLPPKMRIEYYTIGNSAGYTSWSLSYISPYCGNETITAPSGNFTDGSGPNVDYVSYSDCKWLINPVDLDPYTSIVLKYFGQGTVSTAVVAMYNGISTNSSDQLARYALLSAQVKDPLMTSPGKPATVLFQADGSGSKDGFIISYYTLHFCKDEKVILTQEKGSNYSQLNLF